MKIIIRPKTKLIPHTAVRAWLRGSANRRQARAVTILRAIEALERIGETIQGGA